METAFWITVLVFFLWFIFRGKWSVPKPSSQRSGAQLIPKTVGWMIGPAEVFRKEYVSFTRVKTFEKCPRMFELVYLYGFEEAAWSARLPGVLVFFPAGCALCRNRMCRWHRYSRTPPLAEPAPRPGATNYWHLFSNLGHPICEGMGDTNDLRGYSGRASEPMALSRTVLRRNGSSCLVNGAAVREETQVIRQVAPKIDK